MLQALLRKVQREITPYCPIQPLYNPYISAGFLPSTVLWLTAIVSVQGKLAVQGPVVWDSNRGTPSNNPFHNGTINH